MKIIHVLNHFLPNQTAGTEVYVWALSKALIKDGHEVKVVIPNYNHTNSKEYIYDGISVHKYAEPSVLDRKLIMGFRKPDGLSFFKSYLNKEKPEIIHFHELAGSNGIGLEHVLLARKIGAKIIMTFHLGRYSCMTGTLMKDGNSLCDGKIEYLKCSICYLKKKGVGALANPLAITSFLLFKSGINPTNIKNTLGTAFGTTQNIHNLSKNLFELIDSCDKVVCIAKWYSEILIKNGIEKNKIQFISQGLPMNSLKLNSKKNSSNILRLLFLGRISEFKGLHLLIEALESIPEEKVQLSIYGKGDNTKYEKKMRKITAKKANILWKGILEQELVYSVMREHDLLCLCSTFSEMSPLVIQEAKAANLPVLASDVYGNLEQIENGKNGLIFRMNDVFSLREKINIVLNNRLILDFFSNHIPLPMSFESVKEKYIDLYNSII